MSQYCIGDFHAQVFDYSFKQLIVDFEQNNYEPYLGFHPHVLYMSSVHKIVDIILDGSRFGFLIQMTLKSQQIVFNIFQHLMATCSRKSACLPGLCRMDPPLDWVHKETPTTLGNTVTWFCQLNRNLKSTFFFVLL